ncbi:hypothetical protein E8E13_010394 [Curvularia kusanoi]|uniref:Uncharacterized protein n=1 Tax=Curvularia kusanoi TaxID=90978 RepID=A0A9P4TJC0_CURKU|nr:hypothetical protein E8E13_010394 [Curvularia kusanoi]
MTRDTANNPVSIPQPLPAQPSAWQTARQPAQESAQQLADRPAPSLRAYAQHLSTVSHTETLHPKSPDHPFHARRRLDDQPEGVIRKTGDSMEKKEAMGKTGYNEDGMDEGKVTDKA